MDKSKKPKYN